MFVSSLKKALSLGVVGAIATMLISGCSTAPQGNGFDGGSSSDDYVQVCQDKTTNQRVDDSRCDGGYDEMHYSPSYYHYNSMIPSIGTGMLIGYLLSPPRNSMVYRGAVPSTGGYAPAVRPNSGFLKVPDSFVGGPPPIPTPPVSVPAKAATVPPPAKVPTTTTNGGSSTTGKTNTVPKPPAPKAPAPKAPSSRK